MHRRHVLGLLGAAGALAALGLPTGARAGARSGPPRLIVILLRGGLDGLHAVVPHGDPAYAESRGQLALQPSDVLDLDGTFGLHPALAPLHPWFAEGDLLPMHALGLPYQQRSHFDAQDVLDSGTAAPGERRDGWLNRALAHKPRSTGVALGDTVPLVLRGDASVYALDPRRTRGAHGDLLDALQDLYAGPAGDAELLGALQAGRASLELLPDTPSTGRGRGLSGRVAQTLSSVALHPTGPTAISVELGGWDTHQGQGGVRGQLANRLSDLAAGLVALRRGLGAAWSETAVVVLTEFGRTVAPNGTGGTDHGVGSAGLLLGGAVAGGRVLADWPGLAERERLDKRDLRPTTDVRAVLAGVLGPHLGLGRSALAQVFPGLRARSAVDGLMRDG